MSDGTLSLAGKRFEVPGRYAHQARLHLAWARWNLAEVDLVDPETGAVIAPVHPLDRQANASGQRRVRDPAAGRDRRDDDTVQASAAGTLAPLMAKLVEQFVATGLPPGFVPSPGAPGTPGDAAGERA